MPNKGGVVTQFANVQKLNYLHELTKTNTQGYKLVFKKEQVIHPIIYIEL